jgi:hypothetical protein
MKKVSLRILAIRATFIALIIVGCSHKATEPSEISLKQAEGIVLSQILNNNDSGIVVYELPTEMKSGTAVTQRGPDSTRYVAPSDCWFFFIDDKPTYRWTHPCRYAFVSCADGKHTVFDEGFPPDVVDSLRVVTFR